jgi:hypothetical protein
MGFAFTFTGLNFGGRGRSTHPTTLSKWDGQRRIFAPCPPLMFAEKMVGTLPPSLSELRRTLCSPTRRSLLRLPRKRNVATGACDKTTRRANQQNLSSPYAKDILIFRNSKSVYIPNVSPDERGGSRVVTNVRWDAVDAKVATDERDWSGR